MRLDIQLNGVWEYWPDVSDICKSLNLETFGASVDNFVKTKKWKKLMIPSVVNLQDPSLFRFFGKVFYKVSFKTPFFAENHVVTLKFLGANYKSCVFLNGKYLGEHENGYTEFSFDVDEILNPPSSLDENLLLVVVDNAWGHDDWLPWTKNVDWFNYNGIHRPVKLVVKPRVRIADYELRSTIEFSDGDLPSSLSLLTRAILENRTGDGFPGALSVDVVDPVSNEHVASTMEMLTVDAGSKFEQNNAINLDPALITLWSPDTPVLYHVTFRFFDGGGNKVDERTCKWGFRKFEVREDKFFLNNKGIFLRGTNRHEDHPDFGLALPDQLRYQDLVKMKHANINCFRGAHHPPGKALLDYCDELGLLFIEEIPAYSLDAKRMANPALLATAKKYFDEMHDRDKNHACLIAWSMSNECDTGSVEGRKFHEVLYAHARDVDGGARLVIHVSNRGVMDHCHDLSDFITMNLYLGWYSGTKESFMDQVNLVHEINIDEDREFGAIKPIVLTEFGAEGLRGYRSWDAAKWSEDYQAEFLRYYIETCMQHDFIGGTWTWMFSDTRVDLPDRPDGRARSYNNKGMVDEFRTPKLAYDVIRELYGKWKDMT
ncbi:MAG TPA: glycoside hydrolase family 2 TIM barrel-domain containing protein [Candidatus Lokiarchaeia archaeon]|nr:glycoside hydrolase family 2 TIM barrel-domain containing protein [Candidatus Lokiarchaeia archaeon]